MAILFVASEAAELKAFGESLTGLRKLNWPIDYAQEGVSNGRRVLLAANGAGPKLAEKAVEVAIRAVTAADLSSSKLGAIVSTGFSGALDPALRPFDLVLATEVIEAATGERFPCLSLADLSGLRLGAVLSQDRIANDAAEKHRLRTETGAIAVEMEAAAIAKRANRAGLPFYCIKVISDTAEESFDFDLNRMRSPEGRVARGKIVVHALARPNLVPGLFRLKRRTEQAARKLGDFLVSCRIDSDNQSVDE